MMKVVHFKGQNINLHEPAARFAQNSPKYAAFSSCHQPHDPMPLSCNDPYNLLSPTFRWSVTRPQRDQEFLIPGFPGRDFAKSRDPGIFLDGISLKFYPKWQRGDPKKEPASHQRNRKHALL